MSLGQWFQDAGENVANDVLDRVSQEFGLPKLPPLVLVDKNQNPNAYVNAAPIAVGPAEQFTASVKANKNWLMYGGIAAGVVALVLLLKRK